MNFRELPYSKLENLIEKLSHDFKLIIWHRRIKLQNTACLLLNEHPFDYK